MADRDQFVRDVLQFFRIPVERYVPPRIEQDEEVLFRKGEVAEWMTAFTPKQAAAASAKIPPRLATHFGWSLEGVPSASIR